MNFEPGVIEQYKRDHTQAAKPKKKLRVRKSTMPIKHTDPSQWGNN
jgi:hypothetical protein